MSTHGELEQFPIERAVRHRLQPSRGNEPLQRLPTAVEQADMVRAATSKLEELFDILQIDHQNDHNTRDTPRRVALMLVNETMQGRYTAPPPVTEFDNIGAVQELIVVGPVAVRSTCAHHLLPIYGHATIGIRPSPAGKLLGLSKYDRIVSYFSARLQIQEELVQQIGEHINEVTAPLALAVRVSAVHMCKTHRGVRAGADAKMVTTAYFGNERNEPAFREAFLRECLAIEHRR